jgi:hypothetical protein
VFYVIHFGCELSILGQIDIQIRQELIALVSIPKSSHHYSNECILSKKSE